MTSFLIQFRFNIEIGFIGTRQIIKKSRIPWGYLDSLDLRAFITYFITTAYKYYENIGNFFFDMYISFLWGVIPKFAASTFPHLINV